ncbi:H-NS family nucleoid-associated regulatory protein [Variovorax arabinosiphilus]|uniref:H-NS family nucleoid-associated regulatory protein n=1 Tax=Variovorax arabinosiphilus TaxID=3053498 RepID=UPI00257502BB|nr:MULTISPECIES: H-NS family nucleoid-associated regulatory protein [unclassified Variovorax]MDM0128070.1 H-NS family nucleoid-associated regulatory protein [Variovorax sp. J2L1-63]MDM0231770.1 H-NS family nucleoid-associated regulatory protein [Variovorax sp. J2R1-6]
MATLSHRKRGVKADGARTGGGRRGRTHQGRDRKKYANGQGKVWSGRGPRPHWLRDALAAGKSLESFAIGSEPTASPARPSKTSR